MSTSTDINSIVKVKKIKKGLSSLPTPKELPSIKGGAESGRRSVVGYTYEALWVFKDNDPIANPSTKVQVLYTTSVTYREPDGSMSYYPIPVPVYP